jgi:4-hydroxy-tetrahydrodipicolinate reductase
MLRVVQFGTGFVGHFALRAILAHPELELVGVWVSHPAKVGKDAGELAGIARETGIRATDSIEAILALDPDVVCSAAGGDGREAWMAEAHARFLRRGIDVVSSSIVGLIDPVSQADRALVKVVADAALAGGASYYTSGIEPGFMSDTLPLALSGISEFWRRIRIQEILDYSTYLPSEAEKILGDILGLGRPLDYQPMLFAPGRLRFVWGGSVAMVARGLGVPLDAIEERVWRHPASESYRVAGFGEIARGTAEAFRFELAGVAGGRDAIVLEHVTRMRPGSAPDWPQGEFGQGYTVHIDGDPQLRCHIACAGDGSGDHHRGGILATGTRLVNAIPAVVAAQPGLLSTLDLPPLIGRGLYRPDARAYSAARYA